VDEAHHATAATHKRVLKYFGVFEADERAGQPPHQHAALNLDTDFHSAAKPQPKQPFNPQISQITQFFK